MGLLRLENEVSVLSDVEKPIKEIRILQAKDTKKKGLSAVGKKFFCEVKKKKKTS